VVILQDDLGIRLSEGLDLDDLTKGEGVEFSLDEDSLQKQNKYTPGRRLLSIATKI